jgi:hypothetical protein
LESTWRNDAAANSRKIAELDRQTTDLLESKHAWLETSASKADSMARKERQLATQDQALSDLHHRLQSAIGEVSQLRDERAVLRRSVASAEKQLLAQKAAFQDLKRAMEKAEMNMRRQHQNFAHGEKLRMDLKHMKIDNARLVRLLGSTKEYRQFCAFHMDSGAGAHYMSATAAWRQLADEAAENIGVGASGPGGLANSEWADLEGMRKLYPEHDSGDLNPVDGGRNEGLSWIPAANVGAAEAFRREFLPHISSTIIAGFLRRLNGEWKMRSDKQVR